MKLSFCQGQKIFTGASQSIDEPGNPRELAAQPLDKTGNV
jgi:hypothetical protein